MPLDPRRLARDAHAAEAARAPGSIGRETTGVTRAVRALMPVIRDLRAAGVRWAAIAEALARQGIVGADGQPMKPSRLTSVVDRIEKGARRDAIRLTARAQRPDLTTLASSVPQKTPPTIAGRESPSTGAPGHRTAEQIRRDDLADLDAILEGTKR